MGDVYTVFDQIRVRPATVEEISQRCGLSIPRVRAIAAFLEEFGLVSRVGSRIVAPAELAEPSEG